MGVVPCYSVCHLLMWHRPWHAKALSLYKQCNPHQVHAPTSQPELCMWTERGKGRGKAKERQHLLINERSNRSKAEHTVLSCRALQSICLFSGVCFIKLIWCRILNNNRECVWCKMSQMQQAPWQTKISGIYASVSHGHRNAISDFEGNVSVLWGVHSQSATVMGTVSQQLWRRSCHSMTVKGMES